MSQAIISPTDASLAAKDGKGILLDVRTPAEFEEIHAQGAVLVPLDVLSRERVETALGSNSGPVYLLCASGNRAANAAEQLQKAGFDNVYVVEGGTKAWDAAGLAVVRGKKTISLEHKVRIGAGLLVLIGIILGWWVHPGFLGLSAFVGAGLVFAGITDFCGLAIILAKAPWNRSGKAFEAAHG